MRKGRQSVSENGSSATDIMTALIGCLILILLGILLIILVAQSLIQITDPEKSQIVSVVPSNVDGFREDKAFPRGNTEKEPTYVDVRRDRVEIHRPEYAAPLVVSHRELRREANPLDEVINLVVENAASEYVVFLVRPDGAKLARTLRAGVKDKRIDVGWELFDSKRVVDNVSATAKLKREMAEKKRLEMLNPDGVTPPLPVPAPAPESTPAGN
jgi:hypothetical protein